MNERDRLVKMLEKTEEKVCEYIRENDHMDYIPTLKEILGVYADSLLESGVIVPPCKVGDVVYALWSVPTETKYIIYCAEVKKISQYNKKCRLTTVFELEPIEFRGRRKEYYIDEIGKTVFLTREEAEAALAERRDNR